MPDIALRLLPGLTFIAVFVCAVFAAVSFFRLRGPQADRFYSPLEAITITITGYFLSQFVAVALFSIYLVSANRPDGQTTSTLENLVYVGVVSISYGAIIIAFLRRRAIALKKIGLNTPQASHIGWAVLAFIMYIPVSAYVQYLLSTTTSINVNQQQELGFATTVAGPELVAVFMALVVIPPLFEELVMRGFLYTGLRKSLSFFKATMITSVIFGLAHLQLGSGNPPLWVAAADTFILSLFLVYLREKTKSLWPSISLHAIKNGLAFVLLFVLRLPIG